MASFNPFSQFHYSPSTPGLHILFDKSIRSDQASSFRTQHYAASLYPTFGALPSVPLELSPCWMTYHFDCYLIPGSLLDCTVSGSTGHPLWEIVTDYVDAGAGGTGVGVGAVTRFKTASTNDAVWANTSGIFANIAWGAKTEVEIDGVLQRWCVSKWIHTPKRQLRCRIFHAFDGQYAWERHNDILYLFRYPNITTPGPHAGRIEPLAKFCVTRRGPILFIHPRAFDSSLVRVFIVTLVLLTSSQPN